MEISTKHRSFNFHGAIKGFIHHESLDLVQPTSPLDKWLRFVLDDALGIQCQTSLNFTTLEILSDESMINTNHHLLGKVFSWLYNCLIVMDFKNRLWLCFGRWS